MRPNFYALIVLVKGSLAASANVIVGLKSLDIRTDFMKISAESTLRSAIGVADVVAGQLAFCTKLANICHVLHLLHTQGHDDPQTQYKYSTTNNRPVQVLLLDRQ